MRVAKVLQTRSPTDLRDCKEIFSHALSDPVQDYLDIFFFFFNYFGIRSLTGLSDEALKAQEDTCHLLERFRKIAERRANMKAKKNTVSVPFSWVYGREILLSA